MKKSVLRISIYVIIVSLFLSGCANGSPLGVVKRMYKATTDNDMDVYMDTLLPENRRMLNINPISIINMFSLGFSGVSINLSSLTKYTIKDLKLSVVTQDDDYALVQAEGNLRYMLLGTEIPFCDQHDVRKVDGQWYVDNYAPERVARLERVLNLRQEQIDQMMVSEDSPEAILQNMSYGIGAIANLCEDIAP